ncbi:MAG: hypothetical protein JW908_15170 [Anaerolineales bacterium]|nr:hypothetical protein [Anaerolineales bacterium]
MTNLQRTKTKSNIPQAIKQMQSERISEESGVIEIGTYIHEYSFPCTREVVVKIIDKIKKM